MHSLKGSSNMKPIIHIKYSFKGTLAMLVYTDDLSIYFNGKWW